MKHVLLSFCAFLWIAVSEPAAAAQLRIDFSGEFYNKCTDCTSHDTGALLGTEFSGHIIIPDTVSPEPDEYYLGETVYELPSGQTWFELDAADDRFDVSTSIAMSAFVRDGECVYSCADKFSLFFRTNDYLFEMGFVQNIAGDPIVGEEFPSVTELQQLIGLDNGTDGSIVGNYFSVGMPTWEGWVYNFDDGDPYSYNVMAANVSVVPLPPALALFPAALMTLAWFRRR